MADDQAYNAGYGAADFLSYSITDKRLPPKKTPASEVVDFVAASIRGRWERCPRNAADNDVLCGGQFLARGAAIRSRNGLHRAIVDDDGSLCVQHHSNNKWTHAWCNIAKDCGVKKVTMQKDGNLVAYTAGETAKWASNTDKCLGSYAVIQDNGDLAVYHGRLKVWSTNTHPGGCCAASKCGDQYGYGW